MKTKRKNYRNKTIDNLSKRSRRKALAARSTDEVSAWRRWDSEPYQYHASYESAVANATAYESETDRLEDIEPEFRDLYRYAWVFAPRTYGNETGLWMVQYMGDPPRRGPYYSADGTRQR